MPETEREGQFPAGVTEEHRSSILEFLDQIDVSISAIQAAARERLASKAEVDGGESGEIQICLTVGPNAESTFEHAEHSSPTQCWTENVPCGKSPSGYIYCSVKYCETVGPIKVGP